MSNLTAIANGPSTSSPSDGSRTQTIHDSQPRVDDHPSNPSHNQGSTPQGVLRLRGGPKSKPAVVWREDVVDNENMGKKSSKSVSHHPYSQHTTTFTDLYRSCRWWNQSAVYTIKQRSLESRLQKSLPQTPIATMTTVGIDTIDPLTEMEALRGSATEKVHKSKNLIMMTNRTPMKGHQAGRKTRRREMRIVSP